MFLQMQHPDWARVLFLVLSELKNIVTSNKLHYISLGGLLHTGKKH